MFCLFLVSLVDSLNSEILPRVQQADVFHQFIIIEKITRGNSNSYCFLNEVGLKNNIYCCGGENLSSFQKIISKKFKASNNIHILMFIQQFHICFQITEVVNEFCYNIILHFAILNSGTWVLPSHDALLDSITQFLLSKRYCLNQAHFNFVPFHMQ